METIEEMRDRAANALANVCRDPRILDSTDAVAAIANYAVAMMEAKRSTNANERIDSICTALDEVNKGVVLALSNLGTKTIVDLGKDLDDLRCALKEIRAQLASLSNG